MAEKQTQEEKVKEWMDLLERGVKLVFNSDSYKDYLKTMSRFHNYSYNNSLLIHLQNPEASYVAGYNTWKTLGRQVKKGEKGITIISPCPHTKTTYVDAIDPDTLQVKRDFNGDPIKEKKEITYTGFKTSTVFDVSQTDGKELPKLAEELKGDVPNYMEAMEAVKAVAGVPVKFGEWNDERKGYYDTANKEIVIKAGMSEAQTLKTAVHELTHSVLHSDKDHMKDPRTMEVEAESVAFIACQHLNLDTSDYSFEYLASWSSDKELPELKASLKTIQQTSHKVIDDIDREMAKLSNHLERDAKIADALPPVPGLADTAIHHRR